MLGLDDRILIHYDSRLCSLNTKRFSMVCIAKAKLKPSEDQCSKP